MEITTVGIDLPRASFRFTPSMQLGTSSFVRL